MLICRARLRNTSNAPTLRMSSKQIRLRVSPKLFGVNSWIPQIRIRQWIPDSSWTPWSTVTIMRFVGGRRLENGPYEDCKFWVIRSVILNVIGTKVNRFLGQYERNVCYNFCRDPQSTFEISCLRKLITRGQTHRHDRVHNQAPLYGWRLTITAKLDCLYPQRLAWKLELIPLCK